MNCYGLTPNPSRYLAANYGVRRTFVSHSIVCHLGLHTISLLPILYGA